MGAVLAASVAVSGYIYVSRSGWPGFLKPEKHHRDLSLTKESVFVSGTTTGSQLSKLVIPFAQYTPAGIKLFLPAAMTLIKGIGYHEAGNLKACSLEPIGQMIMNENTYKVDVALDKNAAVPPYYIMESRGESTTATSVADIAMEPGTRVLSPIDGTVTKVENIVIYDWYDEIQMEIQPAGHAELRLVILHVDQVNVKAGDEVQQGKTVLGVPRDLRSAFASEIDDYVKPPQPHVHIQLNKYVPEEPPG